LGYNTVEAVSFVSKWIGYLIDVFSPDDLICVSDHGFDDRVHNHDYDGGVISTIGLPSSVLEVRDSILSRFDIRARAEIASLNTVGFKSDADQVKAVLQSLGYV
jgi:hypothetical protein